MAGSKGEDEEPEEERCEEYGERGLVNLTLVEDERLVQRGHGGGGDRGASIEEESGRVVYQQQEDHCQCQLADVHRPVTVSGDRIDEGKEVGV